MKIESEKAQMCISPLSNYQSFVSSFEGKGAHLVVALLQNDSGTLRVTRFRVGRGMTCKARTKGRCSRTGVIWKSNVSTGSIFWRS